RIVCHLNNTVMLNPVIPFFHSHLRKTKQIVYGEAENAAVQETTTQILLYRLLFPVTASPPIAQCVIKGGRLHGLDLSTKHVADDSREPENLKGRKMAALKM
ncbi:hypothetical protein, partial [Salmonella sp. NW881]